MGERQPQRRSGLHLRGEQVVGPDGTTYDVHDAIRRLGWRWALPGGGMPAHQYVVLSHADRLAADIVLCVLRESPKAFDAYFRGYQRPMRYVEIDGWRYWRTASRRSQLLNRCTLDSVEPPRRVDGGGGPLSWKGPPWALNGSPWPPGYVEERPGQWVYRSERDSRRGFRCPACSWRYWRTAPTRPCPRCGAVP